MPTWTHGDLRLALKRNPHLKAVGKVPDTGVERNKESKHVESGGREKQSVQVPIVRFTLRRVHLLDVDAKWGSVKDLLDGCWRSGLVSGDKEGEITLDVTQEKVAHFAEEETIIEIEYP